jgi:hypothetical protein
MPRREDHEVQKRTCGGIGPNKIYLWAQAQRIHIQNVFSPRDKLPDGNLYPQTETTVNMTSSRHQTRWLIANPRYDT